MRLLMRLLLVTLPAAWSVASAAEISVGVASTDITPPRGWRMAGYFGERINTATHDPLHAKAIVFSQGDCQAALVFCDLVGVPREVSGRARKLASEKTGIPVSHIAVCAIHSHTGPLFFGPVHTYLHDAAVAKNGRDVRETIDYPAWLAEKVAKAVVQAQKAIEPVRLDAGVTEQRPPLSVNRRFHMKDGSVRFNPGEENPDIVRPAGPIDPDVGVLLVRSGASRRPVASLTVFAMHLDTVSGTEYSGDYPYYMEAALRKTLGEGFCSLFGVGTCGDINHMHPFTKSPEVSQRIGRALAKTVEEAIPRLAPITAASLAVKDVTTAAELQTYTPEEAAQAAKDIETVGTENIPFLRQVKACKILALKGHAGKTLPLEVQVFRLGRDVAIVTLPSEIFVELGLAIKKASPFKTTLVIELANEAIGYIPTRKGFSEGSYEITNSRVRNGTGEALVDAAVKALKELAAQ